jgi:MFS family permease
VTLLIDGLSDWRYFFAICAIPGITCAAVFTKYVVEPTNLEEGNVHEKLTYIERFKMVRKSAFFFFVLGYNFLLMLLYFVFATFLPIYYVSVKTISVAESSLLFAVSSITMIASGPLAGYLHDKFSFKTPFLLSTLLMVVMIGVIPTVSVGCPIMAVVAVFGIAGQMVVPIVATLISHIAPQQFQGLYLGLGNLIAFLGATIGPILFGYLIDLRGFDVLFTLTLIAYIIATLLPFYMKLKTE